MHLFDRDCEGFTRREALRAGALTFGGLTLGRYLSMAEAGNVSPVATAKRAIFINLAGGPSHMDTFDMKPEAPQTHRGEFATIQSAVPGLSVCEHLPKTAAVMDRVTLLRGVSHTLAAHRLGSEYVNTGNRPLPSLEFPGYAAVVSKELGGPEDLPTAVSIPNANQRAGYLGVKYTPLATGSTPTMGRPFRVRGVALAGDLTIDTVDKRSRLLERLDTAFGEFAEQDQLLSGLDRFGEQAHAMITSPRSRKAFDVSKEPAEIAERFGPTKFAQSCLLAVRLVEEGVPFVTVTLGGWDTHNDGWTKLKNTLLPEFDAGYSALIQTLEQRGLLDDTAVLCTGEFGRTPKINTSRVGRDHYPRNMFMLAAGGGFAGGRVVGQSDKLGEQPVDTRMTPDDVAATFYHCLGISRSQEYQTNTGRPVMIVRDGRVMDEVLA